ncbi:hypothetical protein F7725_012418 [Dissostichus mawsoni]|uniref:REM2- and Rab-like small GTPase 1 n=1 Tax=Dissostichus mawsoni TaxID=36200 RepID=A0A7J5YMA0_DISMA|nr:hypothetical protein F7725_012418 [Dissostichus mawsoni]
MLSGKSGVGKTALDARLAGLNIPNMHHETTGIETTVVYWPVKLRENGRVLFYRLQLWDCGENALRRFDPLLPACKEQVDAVLFRSPSLTGPPLMICQTKSLNGPGLLRVGLERREELPGDVERTSAACGGGRSVTDWGMWPLSSTAWRSTCGIRTVYQPDAIHSRRQGLYFNPDLDVLVGSLGDVTAVCLCIDS